MEKVLYHLVSRQTHTWLERNYEVKDALKAGKKEVQEKLGFLIDTPTSGGGNTDTGGIADRFFTPQMSRVDDRFLQTRKRIIRGRVGGEKPPKLP